MAPLYTRHIVKVKKKGQIKLNQTIELYLTYIYASSWHMISVCHTH